MEEGLTYREKLRAIKRVAAYRPRQSVAIVVLSLFAAVFEGIGVGFLVPIVEMAQSGDSLAENASGILGQFVRAYEFLGVTPTLVTMLLGLGAVMTIRYTANFAIAWIRASLNSEYMHELRVQCFDNLVGANVSYVDTQGSDEILNTVITETQRASHVLSQLISIVETVLFTLAYLTIAMVLSPVLTIGTLVVLGGVTFLTRFVLEAGYDIGDRVAAANERVQSLVQAGTHGLREVKLFNMGADVRDEFRRANSELVSTRIALQRNKAGLQNFNQLLNAFVVFALIYLAVTYLPLSFGELGVFLFAMFRLSPKISQLNNNLYGLDGTLPHLFRTQELIDEMERNGEPDGDREAPDRVDEVVLDDVGFHYEDDDGVGVRDISLHVERGESIALVGPSGAGKSTIIALIARLYDPDEGAITVNGQPLDEIDLDSWHNRIAVVRQHPFIFNETLRYNVTLGATDASQDEVERACEIAQVTAFLDELPNGYDTVLGDDGVRLSGGQRQRVAIARALIEDADVLLLDEATSELDSATEGKILDGIDAIDREYATVVIGHWLSTVQDADRIYTIVDGELTESGTHDELLDEGEEYADLYGAQMQ